MTESEIVLTESEIVLTESEIVLTDLKEEDSDEVVRFMAGHFYPREPLSTGLHMTYDDNKDWIHTSTKDWARSGVSVVARETATNTIVGTLLATVLTRSQNTSFDEALNSPKKKVKTLHKVLSVLEGSVNFFRDYSVNKILELAMITVSADHSGKGIGRRLVQESETRASLIGCELATVQATALPSQFLFEKLGYTTLYELDYSTFAIDGELVFDMDHMMGTPSAKVMVRPLVPNALTPVRKGPTKFCGWIHTKATVGGEEGQYTF